MKVIFLVLVAATVSHCSWVPKSSADGSCVGQCGVNDGSSGCQCNSVCTGFSDCCSDFESVCLSCQDRCGEAYVTSKPCQCNSDCASHGNCCLDYSTVCGGGGSSATDSDVIALSEELYTLDKPLLVGDLITYDPAPPGPLFISVDPSAFTGSTIAAFMPLRDNYNSNAAIAEVDDAQETAEKEAFLDAIMATDVMIRTEKFMKQYNLISAPLRDVIDEIFFTRYSRAGNALGSSGFEHSFMGEIDDGKVKGFHNWISFYEDENAGDLEYNKFVDEETIGNDLDLFMMGFDWDSYTKSVSSMWIGSTPELELALYTVCFYYKPNQLCDVSMNGVAYKIQTYTWTGSDGGTYVGSAYPDIS